MDITGEPESHARSVFMYLCSPNGVAGAPRPVNTPEQRTLMRAKVAEAVPRTDPPGLKNAALAPIALLLALLTLTRVSGLGQAPSPAAGLPAHPVSLTEAVNIALDENPNILRARKDIEATQGLVIQTKAIAIPKVTLSGQYQAVQPGDIDTISLPGAPSGITFGNDQRWTSQIRLVQSLYEGGRMVSAFRTARLLKEQSLLNYQTTLADTVLAVQLAYFDTLLASEQIAVQQASVELLTRELEDARRRFDAGTVPRFDVLRAEVELANAQPRLIRARNSQRINKNNLANLLGCNLPKDATEEIPLNLSGKLLAEPFKIDLGRAISLALERRPELGALRKAQALRREAIVTAKSGYRPSLQAFAGYDIHNSIFSQDLTYENHGWMTGVQLNWDIFDGFLTRGKVKEATARFERSGIDLSDEARRIELEVRTAHSSFIEAQEVLESEKKVVEQAEEALRLARARHEAGAATQLDVLSAQTALTDARNTQAQALHDYMAARARLERAVGANFSGPSAERQ